MPYSASANAALANIEAPRRGEVESLQSGLLGFTLYHIAMKTVGKRQPLEERWLEDLAQFNGQYDLATTQRIKSDKTRSGVFVNITRPKSNSAEGRLCDMLFPTDDRNWALRPTPVPEISQRAADETPTEITDPQSGEPVTQGDQAQGYLDVVQERAEKMQRLIDDQLVEARYNIKSRDAIHQAMVFGTGVLKGPCLTGQIQRSWKVREDGVYELVIEESTRPGVQHVDLWNFFPDMDAATSDECDFIFERHYMSGRDLVRLKRVPGFREEVIDELLETEPRHWKSSQQHLALMREISGLNAAFDNTNYEVFEYHGPLTREDYESLGMEVPEGPLQGHEAIVMFCGPYVLKAVTNPLDTQERPYSVFNWEKDESSLFGYGVPYQTRHAQKVVNGAWRMAMENAALSAAPQVVVNEKIVEPADGKWEITPRKVWLLKDPKARVRDAFYVFEIPNRVDQLLAIFEAAKRLADEETSLPVLAQGEQRGQNVPNTLGGFAMLLNAANVMIRRAVRNWDDDISVPLIGRFYNWNMQFAEDEGVKGDFEIQARGTAALLVKELQAQSLLLFAQYGESPVYGGMIKTRKLLEKAASAHQLPPEEIVKSDSEYQRWLQEQSKQKQGDEAALAKIQAALIDQQTKTYVADRQLEAEMAKAASDEQLHWAQIEERLTIHREKLAAQRQAFMDEAKIKALLGETSNYGLEVKAS